MRAHVVQAIGELDQDDPHVRGHRDHHLAVVLGLRLVAALEGDPGQLGDAVDEPGDRLAEQLGDLLDRGARVLDRVVQQRRAERLGVEAQAGADLRHLDRVGDEVLAAAAALVDVALAGEGEGPLDGLAVERIVLERSACSVITASRSPSSSRSSLGEIARVLVDRRRLVLAAARRRRSGCGRCDRRLSGEPSTAPSPGEAGSFGSSGALRALFQFAQHILCLLDSRPDPGGERGR